MRGTGAGGSARSHAVAGARGRHRGGALAPASAAASLPSVDSGPRPGPDILYAPAPRAPQLENTGVWKAPPILISGASAYRDGEFLYQDWLYDDHGARGARDPGDPRRSTDEGASAPSGSYTYPTDPVYAGNAADLVELRVRALRKATAFRVTLNTLKDPERVAFTIAIGGTPEVAHALPYGANVELTRRPVPDRAREAGESRRRIDSGACRDAEREARPQAAPVHRQGRALRLGPGGEHGAAVGRGGTVGRRSTVATWCRRRARRRRRPGVPAGCRGRRRSSTRRSGSRSRSRDRTSPSSPTRRGGATACREGRLRDGDLGRFHAEVDFGKLLAGVDDDMPGQQGGVPQDGPMNRILASRFETAQGIDFSTVCLGGTLPESCKGEFRGQLQPYAIYVPRKPVAGRRLRADAPASLARRHVQPVLDLAQPVAVRRARRRARSSSRRMRAGRTGSTSTMPRRTCSRCGPTWRAAIALDPDWTVIAGYSMGGYGAYKLASQFPDLFARVQTTVGPPGISNADTRPLLPSLRNIPVLIWAGAADELVPIADVRGVAQIFDALGYRYTFLEFARHDPHPAGLQRPVRARGRVPRLGAGGPRPSARHLCVQPGAWTSPDAGTAAGHAYWVSDVKLRDAAANNGVGVVDVRSEGFGLADPVASPTNVSTGFLTGGIFPLPFTSRSKTWGEPAAGAGRGPARRRRIERRLGDRRSTPCPRQLRRGGRGRGPGARPGRARRMRASVPQVRPCARPGRPPARTVPRQARGGAKQR